MNLKGLTSIFLFYSKLPGRVDLWPAIGKAEQPKDIEWQNPVDMPGKEDERIRLANLIADQISTLISSEKLNSRKNRQ